MSNGRYGDGWHDAAEVDDMLAPRQLRTTTRANEPAYQVPLALLYERFDAVARGVAPADGVDFHQLVVDRLIASRAHAEAAGWTACALERDGGLGRLRLVGVAPSADGRSIVPDWTEGVAAEAAGAVGTARDRTRSATH